MARRAALTCAATALFLAALAGSAGAAEGVTPVPGPWHAITSAGLPVSFEVSGGQVVAPRFRFKWGFCGSFESETGPPVPIEADGHWKHVEGQGPYIEATFVAADRAEGTVTAPSRMLPGCPETHASFVAEPGPQTFEEEQSVVRADVRDRRLTSEPTRMVLKRDGSFRVEGLHWSGFGEEFAHGSGRAYIRCRACRHRKLWRPQASVYLDELTQQGGAKVYLELRYVLSGPTPPGFGHRGGRLLE